ncbi:MAG: MmcQ/YjbR family DNA-binding protein [Phototrophicaceae bacterium]
MLSRNDLRIYCLSMTGAYEDFPFGPEAAVFKVKGKMFALLPVDENPQSISLKCDPIEAVLLRQTYDSVQPGYHMSKKHWNTVTLTGDISDERLQEMIEDSYILVRQKLKKSDRELLKQEESNGAS